MTEVCGWERLSTVTWLFVPGVTVNRRELTRYVNNNNGGKNPSKSSKPSMWPAADERSDEARMLAILSKN